MRIDAVKLDRGSLVRAVVRSEMTRPEVARAAGISYSTFTNALLGKAISMTSARALARTLGVGVAGLMKALLPGGAESPAAESESRQGAVHAA